VSLRWRIALGFALVALATAAVMALATPPIVIQGFSDIDTDNDGGRPAATSAIDTGTPGISGISGTSGTDESETDSGAPRSLGRRRPRLRRPRPRTRLPRRLR